MDVAKTSAQEPIAIIGMGCRVPGANDPDSFGRWSSSAAKV